MTSVLLLMIMGALPSTSSAAAELELATSSSLAATKSSPAWVRVKSRTLLVIGTEPVVERVSETPRVVDRQVVPILEEVSARAATGIDGLSVSVDGWIAIEAGGRIFADRALADLTEGYLEWRRAAIQLTAGRIQSYSETGRGLRFDGAQLVLKPVFKLVEIPLELRVEGYAGAPVTPRFGEEPLLTEPLPDVPRDPTEVGPGGTDWQRVGDSCFGALVGFGRPGVYFGSLGYARTNRAAEIDREALVGQLTLRPVSALRLDGFVSYDFFARALEDSELILAARITPDLRLAAFGRVREPALLLPSTSVLSVFGGSGHQEAGASVDWFGAAGRLTATAELRRTTESPESFEAAEARRYVAGKSDAPHGSIEARGPLQLVRGRGVVGIEILGRTDAPGYSIARIGAEVPVVGMLSASAEVAGLRIERDAESVGYGGRASLSGVLTGEWWRLVLALRGTRTPAEAFSVARLAGHSDEVALLGRFEWRAGTR